MPSIDPSATVDPGACLADDVVVGPFCVVEGDTTMGPGVVLSSHVVIRAGTRLGPGVRVDSFSVVGGLPQVAGFEPGNAGTVEIGAGTILREGVTIHRSKTPDGTTRIGRNCLLMATSHAGHDCQVGDGVTLANQVMLAGHVEVGHHTVMGGGAGVQQFTRIGAGAMVSGNAEITLNIPPHTLAAQRNRLAGLNLVGLRRRGASREGIEELRRLFREVLVDPGSPLANAVRCREIHGEPRHEQGREFLDFFRPSKAGFPKVHGA